MRRVIATILSTKRVVEAHKCIIWTSISHTGLTTYFSITLDVSFKIYPCQSREKIRTLTVKSSSMVWLSFMFAEWMPAIERFLYFMGSDQIQALNAPIPSIRVYYFHRVNAEFNKDFLEIFFLHYFRQFFHLHSKLRPYFVRLVMPEYP